MVKVFLHGKLGKKYGFEHKYKIRTAKEALKALSGNYSGFKSDILRKTQKHVFYKIVDKFGNVCKDIEDYSKTCENEVHIVPSVAGGFLDILLGFILYTAGSGMTGFFAKILTNIGISMMLQGVQNLLMGDQDMDQKQSGPIDTQSFIFNNPDNNVTQGFGIPIIYGEMRVGSNVVSTNIQSIDLSKG